MLTDLWTRTVPFQYEPDRFSYWREHHYTPDLWVLASEPVVRGFYVELKGYFTARDRTKLLAVRERHPMLDLRLLFQDATKKLNKRSRTTYGEWATKHEFVWASGTSIPQGWLS